MLLYCVFREISSNRIGCSQKCVCLGIDKVYTIYVEVSTEISSFTELSILQYFDLLLEVASLSEQPLGRDPPPTRKIEEKIHFAYKTKI